MRWRMTHHKFATQRANVIDHILRERGAVAVAHSTDESILQTNSNTSQARYGADHSRSGAPTMCAMCENYGR